MNQQIAALTIDQQTEALTQELTPLCAGKNVAVVISVALNLIANSTKSIPDPKIVTALVTSFRQTANMLEQHAKTMEH